MIIFGTKGKKNEVGSGRFYCPNCDTTTPYKHFRMGQYFSLYFVALFKIKDNGEYIECQNCHQAYETSVLNYRGPSEEDKALLAIQADLESGTPINMVVGKLVNAGIDQSAAIAAVRAVTGGEAKKCGACSLMFYRTVNRCTNCGGGLI